MCVYVYVASAKTLPLKKLGPRSAPFKIEHLQRLDRPVRRHLKKRRLYFVASFEGCGCIFAEAPPLSRSRSNYWKRCQSSIDGFGRYLARAVKRSGELEVYAVENRWLGRRPRVRKKISVTEVLHPDFRFCEGELITLIPEGAA